MKIEIVMMFLFMIPALVFGQDVLEEETVDTEVDFVEAEMIMINPSQNLYYEILDDYVSARTNEALVKINQYIELFPGGSHIVTLTDIQFKLESMPLYPVDELTDDNKIGKGNGLAYYWLWNFAFITASFATLPGVFDMDLENYGSELLSGFSLAGIGAAITTSAVSTRQSPMTWGRAYAVDLLTYIGLFNMTALDVALFFPYVEAYSNEVRPANSIFPYALKPGDEFFRFIMGTSVLATLGARYTAIHKTKDVELSPGRYAFLLNGYWWSTVLSSLLFSEIDNQRFIFVSNPNTYNLLTSVAIADAAVFGLNKLYSRLEWPAERAWSVSFSGLFHMGIGSAMAINSWSYWDNRNIYLYSIIWGLSGLNLGVMFSEYPRKYSPERTLLKHGQFWGATLTTLLLADAFTNVSYDLMLAPVAGNVSAYYLNKNFSMLQWSQTHTWLVSLSGVIGATSGWLLFAGFYNTAQWIVDNPQFYSFLWCSAGLAVGTYFTRNMATAKESESETDTLASRMWGENFSFMIMPGLDADNNLTMNMSCALQY